MSDPALKAASTPEEADEFKDIRPYRDQEVAPVLERIVHEAELLSAVAHFRFPRLYAWLPSLLRSLVERELLTRTRHIQTVGQFQQFLEAYFVRMVRETTDGFSDAGTSALQADRGYLFVSNHRDIAMDSGFMNYALYRAGLPTSRIAIGDNLLKKPYATDLMRLNKSFVVRRNLSGVKEMAAAFQQTSRYLHHSIGEGASVWIAQREGRAKDGLDRTDPAIIKMFYVSQRKSGRSFAEVIGGLNIVPVAISYEIDPCDNMKANELKITEETGRYDKPPGEDINSIVQGIVGYKGRVHFSFGTVLPATFTDADEAAAEVDRQIIGMYRLWPTHCWAAQQLGIDLGALGKQGLSPAEGSENIVPANDKALAHLKARVAAATPEIRRWLLAQYANPVRSKLGLC